MKGCDVDNFDILVDRKFSDDEFFFGLVFKIMNDFFVGFLIFVCIYFGMFVVGMYVLNLNKGKKECIGWFLEMYVNSREDLKVVCVGDIIVFVGMFWLILGFFYV